jgi:DNA-binding PucR family transcriptional regulator
MTAPPAHSETEFEADLRDRLSSLQGLLALSMVMTESGDEQRILHLATTSVPSLGDCRLDGVYLSGSGWRITRGPCTEVDIRADIEAQFAVLTSAGGAVAITGEGWGAAFPLRSLDGHFGYLLVAADQQPPAFVQFLLRVLAQQTGIALGNARLHARERATTAQLREANIALAATVAAFERRTAIHERLNRVAVTGAGLEGVASAVHELTGYAVAVEDRAGSVLAWAGPERPDPYPTDPPDAREELLARAHREGTPIRDGARLLAIANPRHDVLGVLILFDPESSAGEHEQRALEHGVTVLAIELARICILAETELRLGRDVVDELLAGNDAGHVLVRAKTLGYAVERPHRVVVIESPELAQDGDMLFQSVRRAAQATGLGPFLLSQGSAVVVLSEDNRPWEEFRTAVRDHLGGQRCRIGVGGLCVRAADFPRSRHEAELALRMQESAALTDRVMIFDQLGIYRILADVRQTGSVETFVREWLGTLLDYDTKRRTDLVLTLTRYLEHGGNYDATAKAVAVHRSTLKYRLQRIREISGHDLADPETQFNLQLATRARQTLLALAAQTSQGHAQ